jgi:tRNA 2-thiouridine synthesizing protein C
MGDDTMTIKKFMFVNRKAPYGTIYAWEALEVVLITAAFEQDVSLAFLDDGVFQLKKGHQTKDIGVKAFEKTWGALEDYDVTKLYVAQEALKERGLTADDLAVPVEVLPLAEIGKIMETQDVLLSF